MVENNRNKSLGYFELNNPELIEMRAWFDNLDKNTSEQNIAIARRNVFLNENWEYRKKINNFNIPFQGRPQSLYNLRPSACRGMIRNIGGYNINNGVQSYNFSNFKQFKSGCRSSNTMEGMKKIT